MSKLNPVSPPTTKVRGSHPIGELEKTKAKAVKLLREHDALTRRLAHVKREATVACTAYGRLTGVWGFRIDHLRIQIENEATDAYQWRVNS